MRVGFVLRSTEIKPLFHRFVPLMQKFFFTEFMLHVRLSTSPSHQSATGVAKQMVSGFIVMVSGKRWKAVLFPLLSKTPQSLSEKWQFDSASLSFLFSRMPQGKIVPSPSSRDGSWHDNIKSGGGRRLPQMFQCFNGIRATGVAKLHSEDSLPTVRKCSCVVLRKLS